MQVLLLILWGIPSAIFLSMGIFFVGDNNLNFTVSYLNVEKYIGVFSLALAVITFSIGYGCFRKYRITYYLTIFYFLCALTFLVLTLVKAEAVYIKYLILPIYFVSVSLSTIIFFKHQDLLKSA